MDTDDFEMELDTDHGEQVRIYDDGTHRSPITVIISQPSADGPRAQQAHLWLDPPEALKLAVALTILAGARVEADATV